jgi:membrane-bound serine protease (ClpP class)
MHGVLAFVAGMCTAIAAILLVFALSGVTYYGITPQEQLALAIALIAIAAVTSWMLYYAFKARKLKIQTGKEALIGSNGKAATDLNPNGTVRVKGEFWEATAKNGWIKKGENVKVVDMEGMFLIVESHKEKA